jgi:hypothetical protein
MQLFRFCGYLIHMVNVLVLGLALACYSMLCKALVIIWSPVTLWLAAISCLCHTDTLPWFCVAHKPVLGHACAFSIIFWCLQWSIGPYARFWCMVYLCISFICVILIYCMDKWCELLGSDDLMLDIMELEGFQPLVGYPSSCWTLLGDDMFLSVGFSMG